MQTAADLQGGAAARIGLSNPLYIQATRIGAGTPNILCTRISRGVHRSVLTHSHNCEGGPPRKGEGCCVDPSCREIR